MADRPHLRIRAGWPASTAVDAVAGLIADEVLALQVAGVIRAECRHRGIPEPAVHVSVAPGGHAVEIPADLTDRAGVRLNDREPTYPVDEDYPIPTTAETIARAVRWRIDRDRLTAGQHRARAAAHEQAAVDLDGRDKVNRRILADLEVPDEHVPAHLRGVQP